MLRCRWRTARRSGRRRPRTAPSGRFRNPRPALQVAHSDEEWRRRLTPAQYGILRQAGTELPLKSPLNREKRAGTFWCAPV